jgi:hypothetical protein
MMVNLVHNGEDEAIVNAIADNCTARTAILSC